MHHHLSRFKFWTGYRPGYLQVVQQGHPGIVCPMFCKIIVGVIDFFQRFPGWWKFGKHFIPFRCVFNASFNNSCHAKKEGIRNVCLVFIIKVVFLVNQLTWTATVTDFSHPTFPIFPGKLPHHIGTGWFYLAPSLEIIWIRDPKRRSLIRGSCYFKRKVRSDLVRLISC